MPIELRLTRWTARKRRAAAPKIRETRKVIYARAPLPEELSLLVIVNLRSSLVCAASLGLLDAERRTARTRQAGAPFQAIQANFANSSTRSRQTRPCRCRSWLAHAPLHRQRHDDQLHAFASARVVQPFVLDEDGAIAIAVSGSDATVCVYNDGPDDEAI